jgi:ABC-2 type transport system ATP-binding protein
VTDALAVKERTGYLPEGAPAYPDMTPEGFLNFIASIRRIPRRERATRIGAVAERVRLHGVMRQPIETLSKGYKRRVGLAQAILHDPQVLVLDEPTDGLDPNQKHEVRMLIAEMAPKKAIVLSTHILEEVEAVCTRAIIVARGRIVADGTPARLRARSRSFNAVTVSLRGIMAAEAAAALRSVAGVEGVEVVAEAVANAPSGCVVMCTPRNGAMILPEVHAMLRAKGWTADEVRLEPGRLDEVFRDITTTSKEVRP